MNKVQQHKNIYPNVNEEVCYIYKNYFVDYFNERCLKLFRMDRIRILRLLEITYYIILFSVFTLSIGIWINSWFPLSDDEKSTSALIGEVLLNMLVLGIAIFYINKIVLLFPFPIGQNFGYCPGNYKQIGIATTVGQGVVLISTQSRLQKKINTISNRLDNDPRT